MEPQAEFRPLTGTTLLLAAIVVAMGNFLVVLDTTVANVSIPTISGSLGVSSSQGVWVITSYAIAEAITVPLTGWLSRRFGALKVFNICYFAFAGLSLACGLSYSLGMLVVARILLGLAGGPILPLSQLLLLRIFPRHRATQATVIFAMTTLVAPIFGPILGGVLCDTIGWRWIFFINVPFAIAGGLAVMRLLRGLPDPTGAPQVDWVGLGLLIVWVGALQVMLDKGRDADWFASTQIQVLAGVAAVGFAAFLIWELTAEHPIVDLRIFRYRGFTATSFTYAAGFGAFFGTVVILPLWLQQNLGYNATWSGLATSLMGILAVAFAPAAGKLVGAVDPRLVVSGGLLGLGAMMVWRMGFTPDVTFAQMAAPTLLTGAFLVLFVVPVTGLIMASVKVEEQANAAGLSNFMRTVAGAFATSIVQTRWEAAARVNQTELAGAMTRTGPTLDAMAAGGAGRAPALESLTGVVEGQSVMLATLGVFGTLAAVFFLAAALVWLAPRPKGPIVVGGGH